MSKIQTLQISLSRKQRGILLLVLIVVVLGLLTATVFRETIASQLRHLTYSQKDDFPHNAQANSLFIGKGNDLLVCTQTQVQLFSPTGTAYVKETVSMENPALNVAGKYAVVYDVGGKQLLLIEGESLVQKLELSGENTILCATVNEKGWVAVTSKEGGYKGVVTVYNPAFEAVLAIRLSSRYVSDAVVTPDCRGVYLVSPGHWEGAFENTLLYYTFSSKEEPTREISLGSNVVLSIRSGSKCWILGDKSLVILDSSCVVTASYGYEDRYLKMGSLQGNGFAALFLSLSDSGSGGTLVTVNDEGEAYGVLPIEGQTLALAAQSDTVAVLTTGDIVTTTRKLEQYTSEPNQRGARNIALYQDGTAALISSAAVSLYFPADQEEHDNPTMVDETAEAETTEAPAAETMESVTEEAPDTAETAKASEDQEAEKPSVCAEIAQRCALLAQIAQAYDGGGEEEVS